MAVEYAPTAKVGPTARDEAGLEESFEGIIERIEDDALGLRLKSTNGEEAIATLPLENVPVAERQYIELGAPIRIAVVMRRNPDRRVHRVRILRPAQWKLPVETIERSAAYLSEVIKKTLGLPDDPKVQPSPK